MSSIDAKTYRPHTGSLPAQVLAFFKHHPEEELHISDITIKFDVPPASVHAALKDAVSSDLLKRNNNLYSAGTCIGDAPNTVASSSYLSALPKTKKGKDLFIILPIVKPVKIQLYSLKPFIQLPNPYFLFKIRERFVFLRLNIRSNRL